MFQFPPSPTVGQLFTPAPGINYRWNGTAWFPVGAASGGIKISDTEPVITTGEQWYESDTAGHYMRYQNPDGTSTLVSLAGAGGDFIPTAASTTIVPESRIINGNFAINQRLGAAAALVTTYNIFGPDRWCGHAIGGGTFNLVRSSSGMYAQTVTADATLVATDFYLLMQKIEGFNIADLLFGTAQAKPFTFACSMNPSVAGTYPISFSSSTRSYVHTVTLAAGVWTPVAFTVPGDTGGTWQSGNAIGMEVGIGLGIGSDNIASATDSWLAGGSRGATGCVNMMATASATLSMANVRLYPGSIDYGPCRRLYAEELRLCQRYYEKSYDIGTVPGITVGSGQVQFSQAVPAGATQYSNSVTFAVTKRTGTPTITIFNTDGSNNQVRLPLKQTNWTGSVVNVLGDGSFAVSGTTPAGSAPGDVTAFHWTASAEL